MYPGKTFSKYTISSTLKPSGQIVDDLINSVHLLPEYGDNIILHNNNIIIDEFYTETIVPGEKSRTHFQGIIRIPNSNYFLISGADVRNDYAQIFIARAGSYIDESAIDKNNVKEIIKRPIGSNVVKSKFPNISDHFLKVFKFEDNGYYHAGGMDIEGSIISVPLENSDKQSKIKFLNVGTNITEPELFPASSDINRGKEIGKAGACGLIRLTTGKYLCGVWTDSDDKAPRLDLYLSKTNDIIDGFNQSQTDIKTIYYSKIIKAPNDTIEFQNIQLYQDSANDIFILATENSSKSTPVVGGINRVHILQLDLDHNDPLNTARVAYLQKKNLFQLRYAYNLRAGAGFYQNHLNQLSLYAIAHWRTNDKSRISLGEWYRPIYDKLPEINHIDFAIIELYEDENFGLKNKDGELPTQRKRCLKLYGKRINRIDDFKEIWVQDKKDFSSKVSSIKYILPNGCMVKLYSHEGCVGPHLTLNGTGKYEFLKNLDNYHFGDNLRSFEII